VSCHNGVALRRASPGKTAEDQLAHKGGISMAESKDYCNEDVAKKVAYEFEMFQFLCNYLQPESRECATLAPGHVTYVGTGWGGDKQRRLTCALLESFLLHTRVLHDFFYKKRTRDDVIASDFVPDWERVRPPLDPYLSDPDRRTRLDKALAHLSLKRVEYEVREKKWNVDAICAAIEAPMKRFLASLSPEVGAWFKAGE
jgi:hypothetical protein